MTDCGEYEVKSYRVSWNLRLGWIGDSEGRTWAAEIKEDTPYPTKEAADAAMVAHPDTIQMPWGEWRGRYPHSKAAVIYTTREIPKGEIT
jgi:hypothetical protein